MKKIAIIPAVMAMVFVSCNKSGEDSPEVPVDVAVCATSDSTSIDQESTPLSQKPAPVNDAPKKLEGNESPNYSTPHSDAETLKQSGSSVPADNVVVQAENVVVPADNVVAPADNVVAPESIDRGTGGIKGSVVNRLAKTPVEGAELVLKQNGTTIATLKADKDGSFLFENLNDGSYQIEVGADGYMTTEVFVIVEKGLVRDLMRVSLSEDVNLAEVDYSSFTEFDMADSGYSDSPTILFNANDVYTDVAGYGFSNIRFKNRGYNSETQEVYLAGVRMNDAFTGYSPYSLWSGLNEAMRTKETSIGLNTYDQAIGRYNGVTNIFGTAGDVRKGWRFSALTNSAMYRLRLMGTYASGPMDNGWSVAANVSVRLGGNDWIKGVYYRSFAYYVGADKKWGDEHKLSFATFAAPGERGAQNASTQEVYNMMGDNMYNSNWGYQNGKVRNARVRKTFEPVTFARYTWTPNENLKNNAVILWRTGFNGYTALDWYDAPDPRPDYYRNLPSYFYMPDENYDRNSEAKAEYAREMWNPNVSEYANYQHVDWDRMYNVNYNSLDDEGLRRSKYAQEERHVDQNDLHLVDNVAWRINSDFKLNGGVDLRFNATENYKKMADLLGGDYFLNVDQFAERDFGGSEARIQNDLDYWLNHDCNAQKIGKGGKYGYDYMSYLFDASVWANGMYSWENLDVNLGLKAGYNTIWRYGLYRKGLFAGANEDGSHIIDPISGEDLTELSHGQTSKGNSGNRNFFTYSVKLGLAYTLTGGHRFSGNIGYFNDAPTFNNAFISPRTRNTWVDNLTTQKAFSSDLSYQYDNNGYRLRVTGYYTTIKDQTKVMSFYDDSQNSFTNFAMTGINERHAGIELGAKVPLPVTGLSLSAVLAWGQHIYTSNPHMVQTMDNSAEVIREDDVKYWQQSPIYSKVTDPDTGEQIYEQDMDGNYIIKGYQKHYVPSSPQLAAELALNYRTKSYWFFELNGQYFQDSYLDMNPLYRTSFACAGPDGVETPQEVEYMTAQERFKPAFLLNLSVGKSWYLQYKYQFGFSLNVSNLTNNRNVRTGGYEQTRLIKSAERDVYYKFDPKYFYMQGASYMLNLYFKF